MDPTTNTAFIIFAALSPLLIAFIKQSAFPSQVNALIAFACYAVVGVLGAVMSGLPLTIENAVALVTTATVVGSAAYNLLWSNIGSSEAVPNGLDQRLTEATSLLKAA
jgi:hypothetical protein